MVGQSLAGAITVPNTPDSNSPSDTLTVEGARQNNLKNISLAIPHDRVTAITGLSGSGKSSLAFDTLFAEGQWRYVESLSTYARMFLDKVARPDVDRILNVRPAIAIEQKNQVRTARSTVGTATEVADLLRLLFAKIGKPICPDCREEARSFYPDTAATDLLARFPNAKAMLLYAVPSPSAKTEAAFVQSLLTRGFTRVRLAGETINLHEGQLPAFHRQTTVDVVIDRLVLREDNRSRLCEAIETAFRDGDGRCTVEVIGQGPQTYHAG